MDDISKEMTEEEQQMDEWIEAYWCKRLKWTWLNEWFVETTLFDTSGIATNHPYGGLISTLTNNSYGSGIFSSNSLQTNIGCWFKQQTNQPSHKKGIKKMETKLNFSIIRNLVNEYKNKFQRQSSS